MAAPGTPAAAQVRIDDLRGRPFFAAEQPATPIDVPLPAGTYHVRVDLGPLQRRYTITLEPGATFHLHLQPGGGRP